MGRKALWQAESGEISKATVALPEVPGSSIAAVSAGLLSAAALPRAVPAPAESVSAGAVLAGSLLLVSAVGVLLVVLLPPEGVQAEERKIRAPRMRISLDFTFVPFTSVLADHLMLEQFVWINGWAARGVPFPN